MAVNNQISTTGPFNGNDVTTVFSLTFEIKQSSQVKVLFTNGGTGLTTTLVEDTDYSVTVAEGASFITLLLTPLFTGDQLLLVSDYVPTQLTELESQGGFFPDTIENVFDKLTYLILQLFRKTLRSEDGTTFFDAGSKTIDNLTDATEDQSAATLAQLTVVSDAVATKLDSVVAGANVSIDDTDANNPVISAITGNEVVELASGTNLLAIAEQGSYFVPQAASGPAGVKDYFVTVRFAGDLGGNPEYRLVQAQVATADDDLAGNIYTYNVSPNGIQSGWDFVNFQRLNVFDSTQSSTGILATGYATSATVARFFLPIQGLIVPTAITLTGTFRVTSVNDVITGGGTSVTPTLTTRSSRRFCVIQVTGLSGLTQGNPYNLTAFDTTSRIVVDF